MACTGSTERFALCAAVTRVEVVGPVPEAELAAAADEVAAALHEAIRKVADAHPRLRISHVGEIVDENEVRERLGLKPRAS